MGLFDFFRRKTNISALHESNVDTKTENVPLRGHVTATKAELSRENITCLQNTFIALDTETTGLTPNIDSIIEVGVVRFRNGIISEEYGSLVNINKSISHAASRVNHITTEMLHEQGKSPEDVYNELYSFMKDALEGKTIICAHNASFDMSFIIPELEKQGYSGNIKYIDTFTLSKRLIKGLPDYKQSTIMNYFGLTNKKAHRAVSDAEVCGMILVELLKLNEKQEKDTRRAEQEWAEKNKLTDEECEVMAIILNSMKKSGSDISRIRAYRNSSGYVDLCDVYEVFKFKVSSKKSFVIIPAKFSHLNAPTEPCTKTEGGDEYTRLLFNNPFELDAYGKTLSDVYSEMLTREGNYLNKYEADFFARADFFGLTDAELIACLESAKNRQIEKEKQREELEAIKRKRIKRNREKGCFKRKA